MKAMNILTGLILLVLMVGVITLMSNQGESTSSMVVPMLISMYAVFSIVVNAVKEEN